MANNFLDLYFERIRYSRSPTANLQTLRDLHLLHLQNIPYENIDVFCRQGARLDQETLTRKILLRQRGGYCFEQNGLFLMALNELGFRVQPNLARVHRNRPEPGPRTHHVNLVELDGRTWLCDVGFAGSAFREPLLLQANAEVVQLGETYRLYPSEEHGFYVQNKVAGEWQPLYTFKIDRALPVDMEMANFFTANSPDRIFLTAIIGTRMTPEGRVTLSDHTFKVFDLKKGTMERETVTDFATYVGNLEKLLNVQLNEAEKGLLEKRFGTLKLPPP